jgi:hypothetical protein
MMMMKKSKNFEFGTLRLITHGHNLAALFPNSNERHDGILSIGNFMLMIKNHFALFWLPGNW